MNHPALEAFFLGRAFAEVLGEKVELGVTQALSELGKFDAEQREHLRQFVQEVQARATVQTPSTNSYNTDRPEDLQETIDDLRAEIARLKSELKAFRIPNE